MGGSLTFAKIARDARFGPWPGERDRSDTSLVKSSPKTFAPGSRKELPGSRRVPRRAGAWRKYLPWIIGGALLLAIIAGLWPKPIPVETARVMRGPLTVTVLEEGKTRIRHRYMISSPVGGF